MNDQPTNLKKMKLIFASLALCVFTVTVKAQQTGQSFYDHGGIPAVLSSGTYVNAAPGFVMAGYRPVSAVGTANFFVDKVNSAGTFAGGFSRSYMFSNSGNACAGPISQETNCYGVSIIPTGNQYAVAGAFNFGCLFAILGAGGGVIGQGYVPFPFGSTSPTKPIITESTASPGSYYVCGSFFHAGVSYLYAFKVNSTLTTIWSKHYDLGVGVNSFVPEGIVESNYLGNNELAIAGTTNYGDERGFFMKLNGFSGTVTFTSEFDIFGTLTNERLTSIILCASNGGYMLGGSTSWFGTPAAPWLLRLNANGSVVSQVAYSVRTGPATDIVSMVERFSTIYGGYEYYCATVSSGGMLVLKIANSFMPFWQPGNTNSELLYNNPGSVSIPVSISLNNVAGSPNSGFHVFGNSSNSQSGADFFLNQACFNGATANCSSPLQQDLNIPNAVGAVTMAVSPLSVNVVTINVLCTNSSLMAPSISYAPVQPCFMTGMPVSPYVGNNNRTIATSVSETMPNVTSGVGIYPNPTTNEAIIDYNLEIDGEVEIELYNSFGQLVKVLDKGYKTSGNLKSNFSMRELDTKSGVYLVKLTCNGGSTLHKIVYIK